MRMKQVGSLKLRAPSRTYEKPTEAVSARMAMIRSKGTKLEKRMMELLRTAGIRYRSHPDIVGKPDFRVVGAKLVMFCDSSFWHGRKTRRKQGFKRNVEFWTAKIAYNRARDRKVTRSLRERGWTVLRFWDTDIEKSPERVIRRVRRAASVARRNS